jgi:rhamnose transport system ATP-binding protein
VTKSFGAVRALKGVSFDLRAGEVHALLGENGAGKSTLIKLITGAHQPDTGTIEIAGEPVRHLTPAAAHKLGIACIYQQPTLFPDLTVAENIGLRLEPAAAVRKVNWSERWTRAEQLLHRIGAEISPDAEVRLLSMPEQQLVEIACAIGAGARIVIMDEPTASLTQKEVQLLFTVVRDLRQSGVGLIYITHRLEEIFTVADRVTVLRDGESVGTRLICSPVHPHPGPLPEGEGELQSVPPAIATGRFAENAPSIPPLAAGEGRGEGSVAARQPTLTESELIKMMVGREVSTIYPPTDSAPREVVLSLKNLGCAASGVRNVMFDVRAGEILGLAGLVGAGRTELARILFGITPADAGEIILNGRRLTISSPQEAVAHGIAYVPEDRRRHGLILEMRIAHNLTMAIHRRIFPGAWLRFGAEKQLALEFIRDLDVRASGPEAPGGSLSGGNQQKVSLARWLATKPKFLILDEPTQGVDVGAKREIHKIIRGLAKEGLAVLMISSDLPEILGMSDRIAVMRGGTMAAILSGKSGPHEVMAAALGQTK